MGRLILVTGKGGVGKTTVAAALAVRFARAGVATLVCEPEGLRQLPRLVGDAGGAHLRTTSLDHDAALTEWLSRIIGRPGAALVRRSGAAAAFVAAAPGARELVAIGKVCDLAVTSGSTGTRPPDVVIFDAPSTGHVLAMLQAPHTYASLARGPVGAGAAGIAATLRDPRRCTIVGVTAPTELAVGETAQLDDRLRDLLGRGLSHVVADGVLDPRFDAGELRRIGDAAGLPAPARRACAAHAARVAAQRPQLARLHERFGSALVTLPFCFEPALGPASIVRLAAALQPAP